MTLSRHCIFSYQCFVAFLLCQCVRYSWYADDSILYVGKVGRILTQVLSHLVSCAHIWGVGLIRSGSLTTLPVNRTIDHACWAARCVNRQRRLRPCGWGGYGFIGCFRGQVSYSKYAGRERERKGNLGIITKEFLWNAIKKVFDLNCTLM